MAAHTRTLAALLIGGFVSGAIAFGDRFALPFARAAQAVAEHPEGQGQASRDGSSLDDQVELGLTVYNGDLALVRDVRSIPLPAGTSELQFHDIAATVNPATVHLRSLSEPGRVSVLEQNYEYDLLDPDKLLRKYIGRDVTLVRRRQEGGVTRDEEVQAHLVSYNTAPIWRIGRDIVTGIGADHVRFPELPGNLFSRPTLIWTLQNDGARRHRVEASYLASRLAWTADYVLTVGRDERAGDLDGWVTLTNHSGTAFRHASLQLVAGDLHRVRREFGKLAVMNDARAAAEAAAPMQQEAFADYHLYTLGRKTTIQNDETKQVSLLNASGFPLRKRYVVDGEPYYYRTQHPGSPVKQDVRVFYQFVNDERTGLGMPLPAGTVRVYQADSTGATQFVGEDRIGHTPKGETLDLETGRAFDVTAERVQTDFQKIGNNVYELECAIALRNHKKTPIVVEVNEPIGGTWRMLRQSHPFVKTDAWAARFDVPVPVDGAVTLTYRVRVTY